MSGRFMLTWAMSKSNEQFRIRDAMLFLVVGFGLQIVMTLPLTLILLIGIHNT